MEVAMADGAAPRPPRRVHIEVCLKQESVADYAYVSARTTEFLLTRDAILSEGRVDIFDATVLQENVARMEVTEIEESEGVDRQDVAANISSSGILPQEAQLLVHVFKLSDEAPSDETAEDDESVTTCQQTPLPARSLDGLWQSLIYDSSIKRNVLDYAATAMRFSDARVDPHLISWNRVVLLHGPPGTGKTSLCKALAQKLSIRLSARFPNAYLLEINAHSLFSKWFSESGKLVMKLFRQIQELVEDNEALICVLIDEVESLTAARKAAVGGSEPSDAVRVVNALLTQLDALKNHPNVLILTTSNITEAIDIAFVDRADIKQYIGPPSSHARYEILRSCVEELQRVGILQSGARPLHSYRELMQRKGSRKRLMHQMPVPPAAENGSEDLELSVAMLLVAEAAEGFSGRALRKLPFQAHAFFVQTRSPSVLEFIRHLSRTVDMELKQRQQLVSA